jgi:hypothetical protein
MLGQVIDLVVKELSGRDQCRNDPAEVVLRAGLLQADPPVPVVKCLLRHFVRA